MVGFLLISFTIRSSGSVFLKVAKYIKFELKLGYMCKLWMYLTQLIYLNALKQLFSDNYMYVEMFFVE